MCRGEIDSSWSDATEYGLLSTFYCMIDASSSQIPFDIKYNLTDVATVIPKELDDSFSLRENITELISIRDSLRKDIGTEWQIIHFYPHGSTVYRYSIPQREIQDL